jgi:hypothetical protein
VLLTRFVAQVLLNRFYRDDALQENTRSGKLGPAAALPPLLRHFSF